MNFIEFSGTKSAVFCGRFSRILCVCAQMYASYTQNFVKLPTASTPGACPQTRTAGAKTAPAVPGPVGPSVTAGGDEESFGPGFADPAPEPMPGPGGPGA